MRILFRINLYYNIMINKYYLEGVIISSIIYFIYYGVKNTFTKSKSNTKKNSNDINLLNYVKIENKNRNIKLPNIINIQYVIFVNIFSYIYYKIKYYIKNRYI